MRLAARLVRLRKRLLIKTKLVEFVEK